MELRDLASVLSDYGISGLLFLVLIFMLLKGKIQAKLFKSKIKFEYPKTEK
jgi:hypothetical protein